MKQINKRYPFDSFKDLSGPPKKYREKEYLDMCQLKHKQI